MEPIRLPDNRIVAGIGYQLADTLVRHADNVCDQDGEILSSETVMPVDPKAVQLDVQNQRGMVSSRLGFRA